MKHSDFYIGLEFYSSAGFLWRCTDVGTRTFSAIHLDYEKDQSWFNGPPYAVQEIVFDEDDFSSCYLSLKENIEEIMDELDSSAHPNFDHKDVSKMMKKRISSWQSGKYPNENLLKKDRVGPKGEIFHPFAAERIDGVWMIHLFELFTKKYSKVNDDHFVTLKVAKEEDLKKRKKFIGNKQ